MTDEVEYQIRELFLLLYRKKWVVIVTTCAFAIGAYVALNFVTEQYRSDVLLAPVASEKSSGLSSLAGKFGGLAGITAADLGQGSGIDKTTMALELMKSRMFTDVFLNKHKLKKYLLLDGRWDKENREWDFVGKEELSLDGLTNYEVQALDIRAYQLFQSGLDIVIDKSTGMITVSYLSDSPVFAKQWLELYIVEINNYMLNSDISEAEDSIEFLTRKMKSTSLHDMKNVFYELIAEQTKKIMLANSRKEYVLKIIDPPIESRTAYYPKVKVLTILTGILGFVFSLFYLYFEKVVRSNT